MHTIHTHTHTAHTLYLLSHVRCRLPRSKGRPHRIPTFQTTQCEHAHAHMHAHAHRPAHIPMCTIHPAQLLELCAVAAKGFLTIRRLFRQIDVNGDQAISWSEFKLQAPRLGLDTEQECVKEVGRVLLLGFRDLSATTPRAGHGARMHQGGGMDGATA